MREKILRQTDSEFKTLVAIAASLRGEYEQQSKKWEGSPFEWILGCPSRQRGKIGEQLIAGWCAARDLNVTRSPNSDADRIIEGKRVEIKFSTEWKTGGYKFQQLRNQDYDYLICLGISPFSAHAWIMKKSQIPFAKLRHQHGGSRGKDTWWLTVDPDNPPQWLAEFGGSLQAVMNKLKSFRE